MPVCANEPVNRAIHCSPKPDRPQAQPRRRCTAGRHPRGDRGTGLSVSDRQVSTPTRHASQLCHAAASSWCRHQRDRPLARPRRRQVHDAYVHVNISIKEKVLALTTPAAAWPGRYRPTDKVLAFLEGLQLCPEATDPNACTASRNGKLFDIVAVSA